MLGFRQDLGYAGSVQSVAAVAIQPEIGLGGEQADQQPFGMEEAGVLSKELMNFGDEFEAEVGSEQVLARLEDRSAQTLAAALPFASVAWRQGDSVVRYRMTSILPGAPDADESEARAWLPRLATHNGELTMEHGLHQEIGWERRTDKSETAVLFYDDRVDNPVMEANAHFVAGEPGESGQLTQAYLLDRASGMLRVAANDISTAGLLASYGRSLPGQSQIRVSYANGQALTMSGVQASSTSPQTLAQVFAAAHPRRVQMYTISLSGTLEGSGTHWRASYRWQPSESVSRVAAFAAEESEPYLNLHMRQPIHLCANRSGHVDALIDVRNLLAEGYRPFVLSDGSVLVFAQDGRSVRAGMVFSF
jgi:hypothetical protein